MEGSLFDGPRKYKAGLAKSDSCPKCGCQNTHIHMFRDCPFSEKNKLFWWNTGIFFENESMDRFRAEQGAKLEDMPHKSVCRARMFSLMAIVFNEEVFLCCKGNVCTKAWEAFHSLA